MQRIERVEKLFLYSLLPCQKLNVVDQQHICLAIFFPEPDQLTVLYAVDVFIGELFRRDIGHPRSFAMIDDILSDRMQEVGFTQTDASVEEQRIIRFPGSLRDSQSGRVGKCIVVANDKSIE